MSDGFTFTVLVAAGFMFLYLMTRTKSALLDAILVRLAAFSFMGGGVVGASGWLGGLIDGIVTTTSSTGEEIGRSAGFTGLVVVASAGLMFVWIAGIVPEKWLGGDVPDWLSVSGIVLPGFVSAIPGPIGEFFMTVIQLAADIVTGPATTLFGG